MDEDSPTNEYVYMFGYEDVDEESVNREMNSDFESIGFFKIRAKSQDDALAWGRVLSEWYVSTIFGDEQTGRWTNGEFAAWIEVRPDEELAEALTNATAVSEGQYPDLENTRFLLHD